MWNINPIAVVLSVLAALAIGFVWYGPLLGKAWLAEMGFTDADKGKVNMGKTFGGFAVLTVIAAVILGHVLATYGKPGAHVSALIGLGVGLGFITTAIGGNYLFGMKSVRLWLIDSGYWTVSYAAMGAILGAMQ